MAEALTLTTVTAALASQSITLTRADGTSGTLTIKDIGGLPAGIPTQDCPLLAPRPQGFVSDINLSRDSFGSDAARKTITYNLTYQLFFYPVGEGLNFGFEYYGAMVAAAVGQIWLYLATHADNITGCVDFLPYGIPNLGAQADDTGTLFHGCEMTFRVTQFLEV